MTVNANAAWRLLEGRHRGSWMGAAGPNRAFTRCTKAGRSVQAPDSPA